MRNNGTPCLRYSRTELDWLVQDDDEAIRQIGALSAARTIRSLYVDSLQLTEDELPSETPKLGRWEVRALDRASCGLTPSTDVEARHLKEAAYKLTNLPRSRLSYAYRIAVIRGILPMAEPARNHDMLDLLQMRAVKALHLISAGYTLEEIGRLYGKYASTVRFIVKTATSVIGAVNTVHGVRRLHELGILVNRPQSVDAVQFIPQIRWPYPGQAMDTYDSHDFWQRRAILRKMCENCNR